ncbi:Solute carrier family 40 member 1 [Colletotrichum orbiculare MAFF 240422]|uniref:Solute carrier family 40 member n=1 Tax=Colletotrichum orbiculare (strain 104-T / ATCC 96160 / CBS 514.97 / LARS 414 / MAFF 240422) TaxID=1213857 RepID=N4VFG0_COLOR|nr:Solute carrier family 40 member 1 [Colletotrichum orbiculare MAFF 240422]
MHIRRNSQVGLADETAPLLPAPRRRGSHSQNAAAPGLDPVARRLYLSHFLSTWNSRVFEFGAVLYLATIFPGTLLPMSVYAFTRGVAAILFASVVGQYIDSGDRLQVVRTSIVSQRLVVATSCVLFYLLMTRQTTEAVELGLLGVCCLLACVEKLASVMNLISVEKDWAVIIAGGDSKSLRVLNAQMRRLDLFCKLLGPLFIVLLDGISTETAILINLIMNLASVPAEYYAIARVYADVPELRIRKCLTIVENPERSRSARNWILKRWQSLATLSRKSITDTRLYVRHPVFLPSFASALLNLTVLSFSGQMVTYLLSVGYSSAEIGGARTFSVAFEVVATWVAPWLMDRIGPLRAGLWLSSWQVSMLAVGTVVFSVFQDRPWVSASGIVGGTILSRVGMRGFDLCTQLIVQEDVEAENRGAFSTVEAAWQSAFELVSYASTIVFFRPEQFRWPTLLSVVAVASANIAYAYFVYLRRGHLLHLGALEKLSCMRRSTKKERETVIERITSSADV